MIAVGDKVVCINDIPTGPYPLNHHPDGWPEQNTVYVVCGFFVSRKGLRILIVGKRCLGYQTGRDLGWFSWRFRKLEDYRNEQELAYYRDEPMPLRTVDTATEGARGASDSETK